MTAPIIRPHRFVYDVDLSRGTNQKLCARCPLPQANHIHIHVDADELYAQAAQETEHRRLGEANS